ncbi:hypothetical protein BC936DRAFT_139424 [Jimgerdemannia flammicorona]|uniref:Karyogamy protein n=1 Tax=Jimgerdemannia flammicorona TaxID=994334 RepID=A0A433B9X5_9FUNG|nr:hypothetical protein BC936DRAFT_139424 [Jimgerdemannia flammicorona]
MSIHSNGSPTLSASIDQLAPHITEREQLEDGPLTSRGVEEQATHHKELGAHENHHPAPLPTPLPSPSASAAPEENVPVETAENLQISPPSPEETPVTSPVSRNISLRKDATAFAESEAEQSDDPSSATCPSTTTTLNESATVKSSEPEPPPTTTHPPFDEHEGKRDSTEPLPTPFTSPDTSILSPTVSISLLSTSLSGTTAATSTSEPEIVNSGGVSTNDHHTAAATAAAAVAAAAADTGDHLDRAAASRQTEWTTQIDALHKNTFPHDEIDQAVTDDTVPFGVLVDLFNQGASEVSDWIAAANIAVFALEHDIKRGTGKRDTTELDALMCGFRQNVELLAELADVIGERDLSDDDVDAYRETPQSAADAALPDDALLAFLLKKKSGVSLQSKKLQSEWSGLTHFLASIKKELNDTLQRKELAETMDDILKQIEELSMAIFKFQEERHASALGASENDDSTPNQQSFFPGMIASPSNSTPALGAASPFEGVTPQSAPTFGLHTDPPPRDSRTRDDLALMQIDAKAEPLFNTIESIYTLLSSPSAPADPSGAIKRKHALVADKWENLRTEIEELKEEVKDERWIEMFRSSADQVSSMIEGLDRTVAQCHLMIAQIKTWQQEQQAAIAQAMQAHPPPQNHLLSRGGGMLRTRQSASPIGNGSGIPRPGRRSTTPASPVTSSALSSLSILTDPTIAAAAAIKPPVDKEHVLSQTKNFEAKSRNYTPAIDRMLTMLGNSIASRTNRDVDAQRRFEAMSERWTNLKGAMDDLRNRDLPDMEKAVSEHPISPSARSEVSDRSARSAKSGRILSPEPGSVGRPQSPTFRRFFSGAGAGAIRSIGSSSPNPYDEEVRAARNGGRGTPNTARESGWNRPASNRRISTPSPAPGQHGYAGGIGSSNRTSSPLSFTNGPRPGRSSARRGDNSNSNRTTSPTESRDDSSYSSSPSVSNVTSFAGVGRASKVYGLGNTSVASMSSAGTSNGKPMWNVSTKMDRTNYLEFGPLWKEESEDTIVHDEAENAGGRAQGFHAHEPNKELDIQERAEPAKISGRYGAWEGSEHGAAGERSERWAVHAG